MAVLSMKCINCGADIKFDPETQKYKCDYCLSLFTQEQMEAISAALNDADKEEAAKEIPVPGEKQVEADGQAEADDRTDGQPGTDNQAEAGGEDPADEGLSDEAGDSEPQTEEEPPMVLYECPSCGAEIVTEETTAATFCYYCHSSVVLSGRLKGDYRPDFVIPFAIDKTKALEIFSEWISKKKYVPKAFFSADQIEKITGVYFPYWTYSCDAEGEFDARGNQIKSWTSGSTRYTETSKYKIKRAGTMAIRHVPRNALKKANRELVEGVFPFDMEQVKPFSAGYLSGFQAENRDMQQQEFVREVEQEVRDFAWASLKQQVTGRYSAVTFLDHRTTLARPEWKYALLPVWTLTYRVPGSDETYYFACNGQNGRICGKLPLDRGRLMQLFLSIFVPLFAALLLVGWLI